MFVSCFIDSEGIQDKKTFEYNIVTDDTICSIFTGVSAVTMLKVMSECTLINFRKYVDLREFVTVVCILYFYTYTLHENNKEIE